MDEVVEPIVGCRANPCEDKYLCRLVGVVVIMARVVKWFVGYLCAIWFCFSC